MAITALSSPCSILLVHKFRLRLAKKFINYVVVTAAILFHGLAQACEALADIAELPLVMVLTLGGLVRGHLGQVLNGAVKLGAELAEDLHLSVTETKNVSYFWLSPTVSS